MVHETTRNRVIGRHEIETNEYPATHETSLAIRALYLFTLSKCPGQHYNNRSSNVVAVSNSWFLGIAPLPGRIAITAFRPA